MRYKNLFLSRYKNLFSGLLLLAVFSGCKGYMENDIHFDTIEVDKTYHLMNNPQNPECHLLIGFNYPTQYVDSKILEKIQTRFVASFFGEAYEQYTPEEAAQRYTQDYLDNYKEFEKEFVDGSDDNSWLSFHEQSANTILFNKAGLISYEVTFENYAGGAHGSHAIYNYVIDLKTGQFITESDLFQDGYERELAVLLVSAITAHNELKAPKELENHGFFSIEEISPNGNFRIDADGITYSFNEYEIAAYAVGTTTVHIPYSNIKGLLRQGHPLSVLLGD